MIRDFFLGFIKIYILFHASKEPIYGVWIMEELERYGYKVSPDLIYPTLHDLKRRGLLAGKNIVNGGKVRRYYRVTEKGLEILEESKKDKGADGGGI